MAETTPKPVSADEARRVAEEARETEWKAPSFLKQIFLGNFRLDLVHPFPAAPPERPEFRAFMRPARALPRREGRLRRDRPRGQDPARRRDRAWPRWAPSASRSRRSTAASGSRRSSTCEAMELVTSRDGTLVALLSAHQSIGVPQPLKLFGTEEQKKKFLPRLAEGRDLGVRADRGERRLRSGQHGDDRRRARPDGRLHPQRREALVHQRHDRRAVRRDGAHAAGRTARRSRRSSSRRTRPASRSSSAATSWG